MKRLMFVFMLAFTGCTATKQPPMLPVWRQDTAQGVQGASATFNAGWRDGCESGSATSATHLQRMSHGFTLNESLVLNDEYYNGWSKAFRYCHRYLYQYHRKPFSN